jgi:phosphonate utilization transcriptional regulator
MRQLLTVIVLAPYRHISPSPLALVREHSLTSALRVEIEQLILAGELTSGSRINETELAARFATSRGPVREALQALGEQGLISFTRNRGAFIRQVSPAEAIELYGVRAALEDQVGRQLAGCLGAEQIRALSGLLDDMERCVRSRRVADYYPLNLRFHDLLVAYAGNARLAEIYRRVIKELHLFRLQGLQSGGALPQSNAEHREILAALRSRSPARAAKAMRGHVETALARMQGALESAAKQKRRRDIAGT